MVALPNVIPGRPLRRATPAVTKPRDGLSGCCRKSMFANALPLLVPTDRAAGPNTTPRDAPPIRPAAGRDASRRRATTPHQTTGVVGVRSFGDAVRTLYKSKEQRGFPLAMVSTRLLIDLPVYD